MDRQYSGGGSSWTGPSPSSRDPPANRGYERSGSYSGRPSDSDRDDRGPPRRGWDDREPPRDYPKPSGSSSSSSYSGGGGGGRYDNRRGNSDIGYYSGRDDADRPPEPREPPQPRDAPRDYNRPGGHSGGGGGYSGSGGYPSGDRGGSSGGSLAGGDRGYSGGGGSYSGGDRGYSGGGGGYRSNGRPRDGHSSYGGSYREDSSSRRDDYRDSQSSSSSYRDDDRRPRSATTASTDASAEQSRNSGMEAGEVSPEPRPGIDRRESSGGGSYGRDERDRYPRDNRYDSGYGDDRRFDSWSSGDIRRSAPSFSSSPSSMSSSGSFSAAMRSSTGAPPPPQPTRRQSTLSSSSNLPPPPVNLRSSGQLMRSLFLGESGATQLPSDSMELAEENLSSWDRIEQLETGILKLKQDQVENVKRADDAVMEFDKALRDFEEADRACRVDTADWNRMQEVVESLERGIGWPDANWSLSAPTTSS